MLLPAIAPAAIGALYFTPVTLIGCANRGLLAPAITGPSAIAACVATAPAIRGRMCGDQQSAWWVLSADILALPLALLIGPLGRVCSGTAADDWRPQTAGPRGEGRVQPALISAKASTVRQFRVVAGVPRARSK